jgi:hypothetical protein
LRTCFFWRACGATCEVFFVRKSDVVGKREVVVKKRERGKGERKGGQEGKERGTAKKRLAEFCKALLF